MDHRWGGVRQRRLLVVGAVTILVGCHGEIGAVRGEGGPSPGEPPAPPRTGPAGDAGAPAPEDPCRMPTYEVYSGLQPVCSACHGEGTSLPAFAGLPSFERLIAYNPRFVAPADPDGSHLVALLEGRASGAFTQMPLGEKTYAELVAEGAASLPVEDVRTWVRELEVCDVPAEEPPTLARRLSVEQIRASLYAQLGLSDQDFFSSGYGGRRNTQEFALRATHEAPGLEGPTSRSGRTLRSNWEGLGGPNFFEARARVDDPSPLFFQNLVPLSQEYCRVSVGKEGNDALFRFATRTSTSAQDLAAIRQNVEYLYLRMLGVVATDADVDRMLTTVFTPVEAREGSETAWVAVCSAFIRDPRWVTY